MEQLRHQSMVYAAECGVKIEKPCIAVKNFVLQTRDYTSRARPFALYAVVVFPILRRFVERQLSAVCN